MVQAGDNVTLEIEFEGHPLAGEGVQWRVNDHILPKSLSSLSRGPASVKVSTLRLTNVSAEMAGKVEAIVSLYNNSTASSQTTLIVIRKFVYKASVT